MNVRQVPDSEWDAMYDYVPICTLPLEPERVADELGIRFSEGRNNLGRVTYAFVRLGHRLVSLAAYPEGPPEAQLVHVRVPGNEPEPESVLELVARAFGIAGDDLVWTSPLLESDRWLLCRVDDDGNELEVDRFLVRCIAENVAATLEAKAPGQTYCVKAVKESAQA